MSGSGVSRRLSAVQLGCMLDELVRRCRVSLSGLAREAVSAAGRGRKTSMLLKLLSERSVTESHLEPRRFDGDRERDVQSQAAGWTVMRFTPIVFPSVRR